MRKRSLNELLGGGIVYALSGVFFGLVVAVFGHGDSFVHRWERASLEGYAGLVPPFGAWLIGCVVFGGTVKWTVIGAGVVFVGWLIASAYWH
jgi:hypothetical protein